MTEIVPLRALPQRRWMERIEESDRLLVQTQADACAERPERALLVGIEAKNPCWSFPRLQRRRAHRWPV